MERRIIREPRCREMTGLSRWQRRSLEKAGLFPKRVQIGIKAIGWFEHEIVAYLDARPRGANPDSAPPKPEPRT